jgi:hypothetical protein
LRSRPAEGRLNGSRGRLSQAVRVLHRYPNSLGEGEAEAAASALPRAAKDEGEFVVRVASLLGEQARILNLPRRLDGNEGGGDVDCAVARLDPLWPLRLTDGWRLCQCLHYDISGWYWIIERAGDVWAIDTLDDRRGLSRDGFPTALTWAAATDGVLAHTPVRAAYLSVKRMRKGMRECSEWQRIGELARTDPDAFENALRLVLGRRAGPALAKVALNGTPPDPRLWRRARRAQGFRRFRSPGLAVGIPLRSVLRILERLRRPTGLFVLIVGPDGAGKSTLTDLLPGRCGRLFRRSLRLHARPALLPRPGWFLGQPLADPTRPHARPPHGRGLSLAILAYHWFDFLLGSWLRIWPTRARTGLVLMERGWWDFAVDPRRSRLQTRVRVVQLLGRLLPHPDLVLRLEAPSAAIHERKAELPCQELERQTQEWRQVLPATLKSVALDARRPADELADQGTAAIADLLEERAVRRLGAGWAALPARRSPRWLLPRGPHEVAQRGLSVYQPVTFRSLMGWHAARRFAALGGFRLLPRATAPPKTVREALAPFVPPGGTFAVARANHPGRYVALLLAEDGEVDLVAKVATDEESWGALAREREALARLGPLMPAPVVAPRVIANGEGILVLEAAAWAPRLRPWRLPEEVARALGTFFRMGRGNAQGLAHGDCAPWNLLRTAEGWTLVDWEHAREDAPPFFDLFHYLVQAHVLLGRPSREALLNGLEGHSWIGAALRAYSESADLDPGEARAGLSAYLETTAVTLDESTLDGRLGLEARRVLASWLGD